MFGSILLLFRAQEAEAEAKEKFGALAAEMKRLEEYVGFRIAGSIVSGFSFSGSRGMEFRAECSGP